MHNLQLQYPKSPFQAKGLTLKKGIIGDFTVDHITMP